MWGCFGVLNYYLNTVNGDNFLICKTIEKIPIYEGCLLLFESERFINIFEQLVNYILENKPNKKYILTLGNYNRNKNCKFFNSYYKYSSNNLVEDGDILLCTNTYDLLVNNVFIVDTDTYKPFFHCRLKESKIIQSPFGKLEKDDIWYSHDVKYCFSEYGEIASMTRGSELKFWYSENGFQYLAYQYQFLKLYSGPATRFIIFNKSDLLNWKFIKLIFSFNQMGFELIFIYEENFKDFAENNELDEVNIFAYLGDKSFIKISDHLCFSNSKEIARNIEEAHESLKTYKGSILSFDEFLTRHVNNLQHIEPNKCYNTAKQAINSFSDFLKLHKEKRHLLIADYTNKWRRL